jgi:hypothetical protein
VPNWPKDLSTLPGKEKWTFGAGQGVFAESPDRIYYIQRGSLPVIPPQGRGAPPIEAPNIAPNLSFPVAGMWRNATNASPPGALFKPGTQEPGDDSDRGVNGKDFLWENCILVINRNGDIIENWSQWDKMLRRPHSVYISPYDPEKHVYIVDDYRHAIFKFTHDGKQLVKTIGTPNVPGSDATHFYRPTFMAFNTDGSWYNSDGYINTRVVKFDKNDNYVTAWGEKGTNSGPNAKLETRPNYFNNVHGVGVGHRDAGGVRQRSRQPPHPGLRQGRQVHPHVVDATWDDRARSALRLSRRGSKGVGVRPGEPAVGAARSRGTPDLRVGRAGCMAGRALRRTRHHRGPGTEPVPRGGRPWRRAEVPAAARRQSRAARRQVGLLSMEVAALRAG